ncbi:hypothetical protein ATANTOWER_000188 [Ataeniobius toweri]|uniref:Uncharacterized protein n=1 Tax=Ataeniobius toweri TaxID=208326 RepID=A0ABU7AVP8_9TELE|nr:hypothetical protein [Ataeniobius toweri]
MNSAKTTQRRHQLTFHHIYTKKNIKPPDKLKQTAGLKVHSHCWSSIGIGPGIGKSEKITPLVGPICFHTEIFRPDQMSCSCNGFFWGQYCSSTSLIRKKKSTKTKVHLIRVSVAKSVFKCSCASAPLHYFT